MSDRLLSCGSTLYKSRPSCGHTDWTRFFPNHSCGLRICPVCAHRRAVKLSNTVGSALSVFSTKHHLYSYFVTLTFKDIGNLPSIKLLQGFRRNFFEGSLWKQYGLVGGTWNLEVKPGNRSRRWHPHFHCLVFTTQPLLMYLNTQGNIICDLSLQKAFVELWEKVTSGRGTILDVREFSGKYFQVFKYVMKHTDDMTDAQLKDFIFWQRGKVFRGLFGSLYRNKELKSLIKDQTAIGRKELELKSVCPECGEKNLQIASYQWDYAFHSYRFEKTFEISISAINRIFPHFRDGPEFSQVEQT
ncbi:protein rep [bacterium]|nr:protein rep [bacterium]